MKRDFTHENFEDFLKRSADSLRMKAPDKVWENLSRELNKRRRRIITGIGAFLIGISAAGYFIITNLSRNDVALEQLNNQQTTAAKSDVKLETTSHPVNQPTEKNINSPDKESREGNNFSERKVNLVNQATFTTETISNTADINNQVADESLSENNFTPTIVDSYTEFDTQEPTGQKATRQKEDRSTANLPFTVESVINSYKAKNKKSRFEKQFYFTPTISYRKLSENKSYLRSLDPATIPANFPALYSSVNNNVTHKPDVGFELGFTAKYLLSSKLKIRSGLQFNVNRYDVKAFSSPLSIATIALNNGQRVDSFSTISGYSNVNGYESNWLQNLSFQVSAPVGVEYLFSGNDKMQFGIATTIQPTYVIGDRAYLITNDYKSYTQIPWLIRRWNVNTAFETFVTYKSEKTTWQIGPQVRYQLLSSFISKYPVKENLFDFGLKVGVSLHK